MKNQTIIIEVPEGKKAIYNNKTQIIEFVDIEPIRSKSWEEFCKNHPIVENEWYLDFKRPWAILGLHQVERCDIKSLLSSKEDAEGILALIQLTRLHDEWVGDWKPTTPIVKYLNSFYAITYDLIHNELKVGQWHETLQILSFPTKEMAEEFLECFKDLIEKAKRFI